MADQMTQPIAGNQSFSGVTQVAPSFINELNVADAEATNLEVVNLTVGDLAVTDLEADDILVDGTLQVAGPTGCVTCTNGEVVCTDTGGTVELNRIVSGTVGAVDTAADPTAACAGTAKVTPLLGQSFLDIANNDDGFGLRILSGGNLYLGDPKIASGKDPYGGATLFAYSTIDLLQIGGATKSQGGRINATGGGPGCIIWTPGDASTNTFSPPIASAVADEAQASLTKATAGELITTAAVSTPQGACDTAKMTVTPASDFGTFTCVAGTVAAGGGKVQWTANNQNLANVSTFDTNMSAVVDRVAAGTAGITFTLTADVTAATIGKTNTGSSPPGAGEYFPTGFAAQAITTSGDGTWTLQSSGIMECGAGFFAKATAQTLVQYGVSASVPAVWLQGANSVNVTTGSAGHVGVTLMS